METTLDTIRDIRLYQPKTGYRFSVDALLLYDFVNLKRVMSIADLGAGGGVVGLLLAKKYPEARVTLVELQKGLFELAEKNIALNDLGKRVTALKADIRKLPLVIKPASLVVSNPPFRRPLTGRISRQEERAIARHEIKLKLPELIRAASGLLKHHGRLCLVYLPERLPELIERLRAERLEPKRMRLVHSKKETVAKMLLMEAVKDGNAGLEIEPPVFIYNEDGSYNEKMRELFGCPAS
ncbi:MAG: methyltransferase [Thermodesulfovibrionales bacterium]|nr:methyltransferase [Thermodesulfovibrionales bacterium]